MNLNFKKNSEEYGKMKLDVKIFNNYTKKDLKRVHFSAWKLAKDFRCELREVFLDKRELKIEGETPWKRENEIIFIESTLFLGKNEIIFSISTLFWGKNEIWCNNQSKLD